MAIQEIEHRDNKVISLVQETIEDAKNAVDKGDIVGVAITFINKDGSTSSMMGGRYSTASMVGALEFTKDRLINGE